MPASTRESPQIPEYSRELLSREAGSLFSALELCADVEAARSQLLTNVNRIYAQTLHDRPSPPAHELIRARDCERALTNVLQRRSDLRAGFSVAQALWDIALARRREDLQPAFYAEMVQWLRGLEGRAKFQFIGIGPARAGAVGRVAAIERSAELDHLWEVVQERMSRFADGLSESSQARRRARKERVLAALGGTEADWEDWRWQVRNLITDARTLGELVPVDRDRLDVVAEACKGRLPFAITPYYASLMDEDDGGRDSAIRAQVIPPADYVKLMLQHRDKRAHSCDFMLESDTSPVDLVTRRYPAIVIFKPYNACPQICVYCQRNWEIQEAMAADALASEEKIEAAMQWIEDHPAICEVLITGGDPFVVADGHLRRWFERLARIPHVDVIRIGTRTPVTLPMRITEELAKMLGSFRELGRRDVAVVTHIEHPYEITPETARAVDRLRQAGLSVYNQQVYTFYVSRRFESTLLRVLLRRIGVDSYYTFTPKGKEETDSYRVPLARILQEQKEETRLVPGLRRTDEAVYNVPGLGKNYLRAVQHRDLLTVTPSGARIYEFHPWEKSITKQETYLATDVPVLDYLERLAAIGENPDDYGSIWFYF